jgi:putative DNA primase/helicase
MTAYSKRERVALALSSIPAHVPRDVWWKIAAALKHEFGDDGFELFDGWSRTAESYDAAAARDTWHSLKASGGLRIGSLYQIAKGYGFDPREHRVSATRADAPRLRTASERPAQEAQTQADDAKRRTSAAKRALAIWEAAGAVPDAHPYLRLKGVRAYGLRLYRGELHIGGMACDGALVVPLRDREGELSSLEFISSDGDKRFLPGGAKAGAFHLIGNDRSSIVIVEGYATGASAFEAAGLSVAVAFDAGNLARVSRTLRVMYPKAALVFAVDNDAKASGDNPGLKAATLASQAVAGTLVIPPDGMDLNDLRKRDGLAAVKRLIDAALPQVWPNMDQRPCWGVYGDWQEIDGIRRKPGVWHHNFKQRDDQEPAMVDEWICSPLYVDATTSNREDENYGFLLRYVSRRGIWKKWAMPAEMLAGDGAEALGIILSGGVEISQHKKREVLRYIASQHPKCHLRAATMTGWHDGAFVLPDEVIGADDVWFQAAGRTAPYGTAGTLDGWRQGVAAIAHGNPLLMLAISAAFAGVLLEPLCIDGAGLHIYGDSSTGKTTALVAGISVWGGQSFRRQWRATANGLEGAGTMHTDTLLALDEIGECAPRDLYEAAYALANGTGKSRANKHGEARKAAQWRVFVLSTGETTIAARIESGGIEAKAGQGLRILDVPVSGRYGLFDDLRGADSGARLSDALRDAAARHYGHAGRLFVRRMASERGTGIELSERLADLLTHFDAPDGQERRAARVLAVAALAGELAIEFDIADWTRGAPTQAAIRAFRSWQSQRGTSGRSAEHVGIVRAVSDFIDRCGDARFSDIDINGVPLAPIRDRAGYWRIEGGRRLYLFTSAGMKEAIKGYDLNRALTALDATGALARKQGGQRSVPVRAPDGRLVRLYAIDPEKLDPEG